MIRKAFGIRFFGMLVFCVAAAVGLQGQTFTTLYTFCTQAGCPDGSKPSALVQATNGSLYGTTYTGGLPVCGRSGLGCGEIFKITTSGTLSTIYEFCVQTNCTDGAEPPSGVLQATNGNLYGTAYTRGADAAGTVFKITPSGSLTTLDAFTGEAYAAGPLIQAANENLYGNRGPSVIKITPGGTLTTLATFTTGGTYASGPLFQASNENFYGTTDSGAANGFGSVFKVTSAGALTTLYNFCPQSGCLDGANPEAGVFQASNLAFYGTTNQGGVNGFGTIFEITLGGAMTTLYNFCSLGGTACTDGSYPTAPLIQGTDGNLYGTTSAGGTNNGGTIFEISLGGVLTTLYNFCSQGGAACTDGKAPNGLLQDTNGTFYGTTNSTVFSLSMGLGAFVKALPTPAGAVGASIQILGSNLTGATGVSFNGTAATFTVLSPGAILTTVPTGATTGSLQVVTPSGTLLSNVLFHVLP